MSGYISSDLLQLDLVSFDFSLRASLDCPNQIRCNHTGRICVIEFLFTWEGCGLGGVCEGDSVWLGFAFLMIGLHVLLHIFQCSHTGHTGCGGSLHMRRMRPWLCLWGWLGLAGPRLLWCSLPLLTQLHHLNLFAHKQMGLQNCTHASEVDWAKRAREGN